MAEYKPKKKLNNYLNQWLILPLVITNNSKGLESRWFALSSKKNNGDLPFENDVKFVLVLMVKYNKAEMDLRILPAIPIN